MAEDGAGRGAPEDGDDPSHGPAGPPPPPRPVAPSLGDVVSAGVGLMRLSTGASWRVASWGVHSSLQLTRRLAQATMEGESPPQVAQAAITELRNQARTLLGLELLADPDEHRGNGADADTAVDEADLRRRGAELLRRSADVHYQEPFHPAYARILGQLAPDEARLLRLLHLEGPQPSVDVRSGGPLPSSSELVAPGLTMMGSGAGCRYLDRVPSYLNNLYRLGLVWFSREPVPDLLRYQLLEAQPDVVEALRQAKRGKTVRRSIHLTAFGADFCRVCLPSDGGT